MDSSKWETQVCDKGDVCETKQFFEKGTNKILRTERDCNEKEKCEPGCKEQSDGTIKCESCCDKDFCNTGLNIRHEGGDQKNGEFILLFDKYFHRLTTHFWKC